MGAEGVGGSEDWLLSVPEVGVPDSEMEIMNGHEQVGEEWGPAESQAWSAVPLRVELPLDVFSWLLLVTFSLLRTDGPVDESNLTLI